MLAPLHWIRMALIFLLLLSGATQAGEFFVVRQGGRLMLEGQPYRFASVNIPNYFIVEDRATPDSRAWHRVTAFEQRDAVRTVKRLGGQAFRVYCFSVEGGLNVEDDMAHIYADAAGNIRYNEELFQDVDRGLAIAAEEGVRIIIPLVDNWAWFGGHVEWAKLTESRDFWSDAKARTAFRDFITWLLNRKNTVNGRRYKDDPTILAWELGNDLGKATPAWISEMAAHLKRHDANHLVMDGGHHVIHPVSLKDPNIDIVTTHYTHDKTVEFARRAVAADKVYILGEFSPISVAHVKAALMQAVNSPASGAMMWSLRFHADTGGFYYHADFDGDSDSLQYPQAASQLPADEREILSVLRQAAFAMNGLSLTPEPPPEPPTLLPIITPAKINWQGSAGAESYEVQRRMGDNGPWQTLASGVSDALSQLHGGELMPKLPLFSDSPANGVWSYRIIARNARGASQPSNIVQVNVQPEHR